MSKNDNQPTWKPDTLDNPTLPRGVTVLSVEKAEYYPKIYKNNIGKRL